MLQLRPLQSTDQHILWDVFHTALWDPPPAPPRPRALLDHPDIRIYAADWASQDGDIGLLATMDQQPVGACWMRRLERGLGFVDLHTPQLGIALLPGFQGRGFGRQLLPATLQAAQAYGYQQVALTVHPQNPAIKLYLQCGFRKIEERNTYHLMLHTFNQ